MRGLPECTWTPATLPANALAAFWTMAAKTYSHELLTAAMVTITGWTIEDDRTWITWIIHWSDSERVSNYIWPTDAV